MRHLRRTLCRMGVHEWISIPLRSITMPNGRQHIISTSCCKHCGERNDFR